MPYTAINRKIHVVAVVKRPGKLRIAGKYDAWRQVRQRKRVSAIERQFRDAHAVNSHLAFNFDAAGTNYGRVALGLPSENLTL